MTRTRTASTAKATRTVAGHRLSLTAGRRYLASRPIVARGCREYPVSIKDVTDGFDFDRPPCLVVAGLDYDAANALLNAFNNGETSFEGRVWG